MTKTDRIRVENRNREDSIRVADEAVVAKMGLDNITTLSKGPLETGAERIKSMSLSVTEVAGR